MEYYAPVQGSPSTFAGLEADPATGGTTGVVLSLPQLEEWHHMHHASSPNSATDTGLEEAVWQLSLQGTEGMESVPGSYPERPGEQECTYYMRTGLCGFGMSCRYHHPPNRKLAAMLARGKGEYPERIGQPECQYYLKTGMCKFGATCKYHHPRDKAGSAGRVQLNLLGFPLRAGEKECAYYMRTGACKYGVTCKFHHPSPAVGALVSMPSSPLYTTGGSPSGHNPQQYPPAIPSWPVARGSYLPSPRLQGPSNYAPLLLSSPHGVVPMSAWGYSPGPMASPDGQQQAALGTGFVYGPVQEHIAGVQGTFTPYLPGSAATGLPAMQAQQYGTQKDGMFPERPGQQECQYYMKTGDCKFGATCRYHHPKDRVTPSATCILSPMGLPIRPGAPQCTYYMRNGICKFGPTCKFDHPLAALAYNPSAEAPYAIVAPPTILMSGDAAGQDGKQSISGTAIEDIDSQGQTPANKGSEEITAGINTSQGGTQVSSNGITSQADSAVSS